MDAAEQNEGLHTEQQVREYFEGLSGWTVEKLDTGKPVGRAPDFRICHGDRCFLCEVKTIESVRADIPYGPVEDYRVDERAKAREEVDALVRAHPDRRLIMAGERREWLHAPEMQLRKRYRHSRRNTESQFRELFEGPLRQHFGACPISELPYDVRLDSDDLYVPSEGERHRFLDWLENEIRTIDRGDPADRRWVVEKSPHTSPVYSIHYPLHERIDEHETRHVVSVRLQRRMFEDEQRGLRIDVHCYGTLNVERVAANVEQALEQLRDIAAREDRNASLPRVVVLRFERGLHPVDDLELLEEEIRGLFGQYDDLSAIAVLQWRPDGHAPPAEQGISAWFRFLEDTRRVLFFTVYHNTRVSGATKPLDPNAFTDKWSTHRQVGPQ